MFKKFNDLPIKLKMAGGFGITILLMAALGLAGYTGIEKVSVSMEDVVNNKVAAADASMKIVILIKSQQSHALEYLDGDKKAKEMFASDKERIGELLKKMDIGEADHLRTDYSEFVAIVEEPSTGLFALGDRYGDYENGVYKEMLDAIWKFENSIAYGTYVKEQKNIDDTLKLEAQKLRRHEKDIVIYIDPVYRRDVSGYWKSWNEDIANIINIVDASNAYTRDEKEQVKANLNSYKLKFEELMGIRRNINARTGEYNSKAEELNAVLAQVEAAVGEAMQQAGKETKDTRKSSALLMLALSALAVVGSAGLGFVASRAIVSPITAITKDAKVIADGNLSHKIKPGSSKDEIGELQTAIRNMHINTARPVLELSDAAAAIADGDLSKQINIKDSWGDVEKLVNSFKKMQEGLKALVIQIQEASRKVSSSSQSMASSSQEMNTSTEQVSTTVQQISKGAQEQAAQIAETSKLMGEMAKGIKEVADRAANASEMANNASKAAQGGGEASKKAVDKMTRIQKVVMDSSGAVKGLGGRSNEIGQIVDMISGIAEQTNLLALNAAIEAARAGDAGRGFAVVANEVRNLAEESKRAAEKIARLIAETQTETGKAVQSMDSGVKEVIEGNEIVSRALSAFEEISVHSQSIANMINEISATMKLQEQSVEKVVKAIDGIAAVAEESAASTQEASAAAEEMTASMEEMSASAQELAGLGRNLDESMNKFKLGGNNGN